MQIDRNICSRIVETAQQAYAEKLFAGTSGNLSVYDRKNGLMYITPTSARYETMKPEDVVVMHLDGTILTPGLRPSSEWRMHAEVYARLPELGALVHTHSPCASAYAVVQKPIPPTLIEMHVFLGGAVPCAKYARPGTPEVGIYAAQVLPGFGGCLLNNHGVLAVGADLSQAFVRAEYIEDTAKINLLATQLGAPAILPEL